MVVLTTILILVLKVFDVVRVLTNGRNDTEVIANFFYTQFEGGAVRQRRRPRWSCSSC